MKLVDDRQINELKRQKRSTISQMPEGYYSGDKPNPNLRAFVEEHLKEKPYNPRTDKYDIPAFDKPITSSKATAIYNMHTYWSKKPHDAIREYIRHYTEEGDLVLDPFCGSGGTALAALMEGRKAIAIDRSPAATFITKNYCTPVDPEELKAAFEELKVKVKSEIEWLYETRCDRCGGKATTAYTVYSQVFQCPRCLEKIPLFDCIETEGQTKAGEAKKIRVCPHCYSNGHLEEIQSQGEKFGSIPVLVRYICECGCKPQRGERHHNDPDSTKQEFFKKYDLGKIREIEGLKIPYWYPENNMMNASDEVQRWALLWRPYLGNRKKVSDFFQHRNLWALAKILDGINHLEYERPIIYALKFAFSSNLYNSSDMYRFRESGKGGISMGTYYIGPIFQVMNSWRGFHDKINDLLHGYSSLRLSLNKIVISTQDSRNIPEVYNNNIDYIFTDPPYSWKVQYGESNFIWESWLRFDYCWHDDEIIENDVRGLSKSDWANKLKQSMSECYRVLKPNRWLSLCYHDSSEGTWALLQDLMAEVGFISEISNSAQYIDTAQKSWKQIVADKVNKRDLVINFRKPRLGEISDSAIITGDEDTKTFAEKVRSIICDYLSENPGATKDRIYDELISKMVQTGQMEAHNFDAALRRVAESVRDISESSAPDRWYLKESELSVVDQGETAKEDAAASLITSFIQNYLDENPGNEGVHYSDIFEFYIYAVKDKPRRSLADWLLDYFYKTDHGTYRLPATEDEEEVKKRGREQGTHRRIKKYIALLSQGSSISLTVRPDIATLVYWLKHCRRAGMYEEGIFLYERGGLVFNQLTEAQIIDIEEDYLVCRKMNGKAAPSKKKQVKSIQKGLV